MLDCKQLTNMLRLADHTQIKGDGAFEVSVAGESVIIGTPSIHSMWSAIGTVQRARAIAAGSGLLSHGQSHGWVEAYSADVLRSAIQAEVTESTEQDSEETSSESNDTTEEDDIDTHGRSSSGSIDLPVSNTDVRVEDTSKDEDRNEDGTSVSSSTKVMPSVDPTPARVRLTVGPLPDKLTLNAALRQIVGSAADPDTLTTRDVICGLEKRFGSNLVVGPSRPNGYSKAYLDEEILRVYGQLEPASLIVEQLYLGSEYNASNKVELKRYVRMYRYIYSRTVGIPSVSSITTSTQTLANSHHNSPSKCIFICTQ
jgi:hypothetical protein